LPVPTWIRLPEMFVAEMVVMLALPVTVRPPSTAAVPERSTCDNALMCVHFDGQRHTARLEHAAP